MLVISRKTDQTVVLGGQIVVRVLEISGGRVRLGIEAPSEVTILRGELAADAAATPPCGVQHASSVAALQQPG
jgi:carbon storage regulator